MHAHGGPDKPLCGMPAMCEYYMRQVEPQENCRSKENTLAEEARNGTLASGTIAN